MIDVLRYGSQQRLPSGTVRFEGVQLGSEVSFFLVHAVPGSGSALHVHPYTETWIVRRGTAEFTVGAEREQAHAGDIVVGPANTPHRFVNVGQEPLELICIHPSDRILQQNFQEKTEGQPA